MLSQIGKWNYTLVKIYEQISNKEEIKVESGLEYGSY